MPGPSSLLLPDLKTKVGPSNPLSRSSLEFFEKGKPPEGVRE
jgi:hypothetical protein